MKTVRAERKTIVVDVVGGLLTIVVKRTAEFIFKIFHGVCQEFAGHQESVESALAEPSLINVITPGSPCNVKQKAQRKSENWQRIRKERLAYSRGIR
jgi:hypothetical protein